MHRVIPKSFIVAETGVNVELLNQYLAQVVEESYAREYKMDPNLSEMDERKAYDYNFATTEVAENIKDATPAEALVALMGRMCYRSFAPGLNPNVSRTRTGITPYIDHIFKSGHGSVLEHSTVSVVFHNVSRVFCYHPDTEIYTKDGWKKVTEIKDDELLLVKNPATGKSYFAKNKKLHSFDFDGELYGYKNNQMISPLVNGAHLRWAAPYDLRKNRGLNNDRITEHCEKITAESLDGRRFVVDHKITRSDLEVQPDILVVAGYSFHKLTLAKFLGLLATDGSIDKDLKHISVTQTKENVKEVLRYVFGHLFKNYAEYKQSSTHSEFRLHDPNFAVWCATNLGRLKSERHLSDFIMDGDLAFKEAFVDGLLLGDGNTHLENGHQVLYCQTSEAASQYQVLFAELGNSSNVREVDRTGESHQINGVPCTYTKPYYVLSIHRKHSTLVKQENQFRQAYTGKIYCPQTDEGIVLVRNKGIAVWDCNTHEVVRHRAGTAMSQESLRFVRLDDLGLWLPPEIQSDPELVALFESTFSDLETLQLKMAAHCKIDDIKNFDIKKKLTSAFRRIAPEGLATTIGFTANFRAWRHMFTMRGSGGAEAEMRIVFFDLAKQFATRYKTMFGDLRFVKLDTKQQFAVNELPEYAVWSDYEIVLLHTGV